MNINKARILQIVSKLHDNDRDGSADNAGISTRRF
jgi:hypothetical protein